MNKLALKIFNVLKSRLVLNIIFWIFIVYELLHNTGDGYVYEAKWYYLAISITTAMMIFITYYNNLYLIPLYWAQKKYKAYLLHLIAFLTVISGMYAVILKGFFFYFPKMLIYQISTLSSSISGTDWSVSKITDETLHYVINFLTWISVMIIAWYRIEYGRREKEIMLAQKKHIETELNFLKSQINPHFLFNTLNNIYGLAGKKSDKTQDVILKLSAILRYLLYESNANYITYEKERDIMQAYIDLELLRLSDIDQLRFSIDADGAYQLPPLLWLPILENLFKHGTRIISDELTAEYKFNIQNNVLNIYTKNSNRIAHRRESDQAGGIGLDNLKKRLSLLYPGKHDIEITENDDYYISNVTIQLA